MRPVVSSFVLALLPALLPAQDFGAKSLQDLYPLPVDGKKWVRSELPFAVGDLLGPAGHADVGQGIDPDGLWQ